MSEGELIEVEQRFRALVSLIEQTKPHIGASRKRAESELKSLRRDTENRDNLTRWQAQEMSRLEKLESACEDLAHDLERQTESCHEDKGRMMDLIRMRSAAEGR